MWKTNYPSLLRLFLFPFALFVFWFTVMLLQKAKSEWEGGKEKERGGEGGRGENDRKLDRRTRWRVCEIRKQRQTTLLYILEAVGQYLNNSWSREMDFFFFTVAVGPQRLRVSQLSYLLEVREQPRRQLWTTSTCPTFTPPSSLHLLFNSSTPFIPQCGLLLLLWGIHDGRMVDKWKRERRGHQSQRWPNQRAKY